MDKVEQKLRKIGKELHEESLLEDDSFCISCLEPLAEEDKFYRLCPECCDNMDDFIEEEEYEL